MKIHLSAIGGHRLAADMEELAAHSARHVLAAAPEEADLILLCGSFARRPRLLLDHPLYGAHRDKCAVYTGDDAYCPLAPGVYTSPRRGLSTLVGRVRSQAYASGFSVFENAAVAEARAVTSPVTRQLCYVFSFVGTPSSRLRRRLLDCLSGSPDGLVVDSSATYRHADISSSPGDEAQTRYVEGLLASRFALCPRGAGSGSLRLFEVMSLGVAPVLLSDAYVLPRGPAWGGFLLRVRERRVCRIPRMLAEEVDDAERRGELARRAWEEWFSDQVIFDRVVEAAADAISAAKLVEPLYRHLPGLLHQWFRLRLALVGLALRARPSPRR